MPAVAGTDFINKAMLENPENLPTAPQKSAVWDMGFGLKVGLHRYGKIVFMECNNHTFNGDWASGNIGTYIPSGYTPFREVTFVGMRTNNNTLMRRVISPTSSSGYMSAPETIPNGSFVVGTMMWFTNDPMPD